MKERYMVLFEDKAPEHIIGTMCKIKMDPYPHMVLIRDPSNIDRHSMDMIINILSGDDAIMFDITGYWKELYTGGQYSWMIKMVAEYMKTNVFHGALVLHGGWVDIIKVCEKEPSTVTIPDTMIELHGEDGYPLSEIHITPISQSLNDYTLTTDTDNDASHIIQHMNDIYSHKTINMFGSIVVKDSNENTVSTTDEDGIHLINAFAYDTSQEIVDDIKLHHHLGERVSIDYFGYLASYSLEKYDHPMSSFEACMILSELNINDKITFRDKGNVNHIKALLGEKFPYGFEIVYGD